MIQRCPKPPSKRITPTGHSRALVRKCAPLLLGFAFILAIGSSLHGQVLPSLQEAEPAYNSGNYELALEQSKVAIERGIWNERWYLLGIKTALTLGRREEAETFLEAGLTKFASSIQLRWLGAQLLREQGRHEEANTLLDEIADLSTRAAWRYTDRANRTTMARYLLDQGADPKVVLQDMLDRVKTQDPRYVDAYLATAELALSKHDYAMAAEELQQALDLDSSNPELHWRLGQAFLPSNPQKAMEYWEQCLKLNPRFIPCLLSLINRAIDAENRALAEALLDQIQAINPLEPTQYIYRAVLAFLNSDTDAYEQWQARSEQCSPANASLAFLLGSKLSQKYHFAEGVVHQRRALSIDPTHEEAQLQLGQDLLRLGDESGWTLIEQVRERDPFQVTAYNLTQLQTELAKFTTLESDGFVVRMTNRDAELYGDEVLELLREAKIELADRYAFELESPVLVEIFARPSDFAVRTFGVPGASGYLGVCFGHLITVAGPAAHSPPTTSWQSVLWHELTHSFTLGKSRHRIPRWLSEGLSVHEEGRRDPAWQRASRSSDRSRILSGQAPKVSELSELFLRPQSPSDIDFAYFLSGWVVDFLEREAGIEGIRELLDDLAAGVSFDEGVARRWGTLTSIDTRFADYARNRALLEGALDPELATYFEGLLESEETFDARDQLLKTQSLGSESFAVVERSLAAGELEQAVATLSALDQDLPAEVDRLRIWGTLIELSKQTDDQELELETLLRILEQSSLDSSLLSRATDLASTLSRSDKLRSLAQKSFELDPLSASSHRWNAEVAIQEQNPRLAIRSLERLLKFDTSNPLQIRVRLAEQWILLENFDQAEHQLVLVLLQAPRSREVLQLYRTVRERSGGSQASPTPFPASQDPAESPTK